MSVLRLRQYTDVVIMPFYVWRMKQKFLVDSVKQVTSLQDVNRFILNDNVMYLSKDA